MINEQEKKTDDLRLRKILYHATHRGTHEMDILIGTYVQHTIHKMHIKELNDIEKLLSFSDAQLGAYFFEDAPIEDETVAKLVARIKQFFKNKTQD